MSRATTRAAAPAEVEDLLRAGAVLPPGTVGGGEPAAPVRAQPYRHPGLEGRVVVRLVTGDAAGGAGSGFLGLVPEGEPTTVGVGRHQALGFPDWILTHHPSDAGLAMSVAEEMDTVAKTARARPKKARASYEAIGERLAGSVPHFLPTVYEQAGRAFLAAGRQDLASRMFVNARKAETAHNLPFDEARMDAVFLEFDLAGAVPATLLTSYAKGLSARVPAATAFRHLRGLLLRLAAHGGTPSAPAFAELRKLARAVAGKNALAEEMAWLREMLTRAGTAKASPSWWKTHRTALRTLARNDPGARGNLLGLMPQEWDRADLAQWIGILDETGAAAGLCDASLPPVERCPDGTAGWLRRFLATCRKGRPGDNTTRLSPPELYPLVDRMADVLRTELTTAGNTLQPPRWDIDLLDQLLALRIPIADPGNKWLNVHDWATRDQRRGLHALSADTRFHKALPFESAVRNSTTAAGLLQSPSMRPVLAAWLAEVGRACLTSGLGAWTGFASPFQVLQELPVQVLALAEEEVRQALSTGPVKALAHTLRGGILDELGWPAWEEAIGPAASGEAGKPYVAEAWPHLIVVKDRHARVIDAQGTVLTHRLQLPDEVPDEYCDVRYVDGALLVVWQENRKPYGYWYHPDTGSSSPVAMDGQTQRVRQVHDIESASVPLPGGGRFTGGGVLQRGDTRIPWKGHASSDGTSYWCWSDYGPDGWRKRWRTYDVASDTTGEPGLPGWFAEGLRAAPEGSALLASWLLPAPSVVPGPVCAPVDGLLGWRVIERPHGWVQCEDLAGRTTVLRKGKAPAHVLVFPGTDRLVTVVPDNSGTRELFSPEGELLAELASGHVAGPFSAGTPVMPPLPYWPLLQPRDPEGSATLRRIDDDTVAALFEAALKEASETDSDERREEHVPALVRTLLPEVRHEALRAGITGVVRLAAERRHAANEVLARMDTALAQAAVEKPRPTVGDELLEAAVNGVGLTSIDRFTGYGNFDSGIFDLPGSIGQAIRGDAAGQAPRDASSSLKALDAVGGLSRLPAIMALRAASQATIEEHRKALSAFLAEFEAHGLAELNPDHWRCVQLDGDKDEGSIRGLGGGAVLVFPYRRRWKKHVPVRGYVSDPTRLPKLWRYDALFHDPSGRFDEPESFTLLTAEPFVPEPTRPAGWVAAFRAELAARGPAPWFPAAAEEFARLTGVTPTMARLVVAGLPGIDRKASPPTETLKTIGVKTADARLAKDELQDLDGDVRQAVVAALLPDDPSRLWTHGPDAARAAEVWNQRVGGRNAVPEDVLHDAIRAVRSPGREPGKALYGFVGLPDEPWLTRSMKWTFRDGWTRHGEKGCTGFQDSDLTGAVPLAAWLAHRLPAGDALRAVLPDVLQALRDRLAHPDMMIRVRTETDLEEYCRAAGDPAETGDGYERYGAVLVSPPHGHFCAIRTALLDETGNDPHLEALFPGNRPNTIQTALRLVHDPAFAALLADPGDPVAGERDTQGLWWPQNPAQSVPDLVAQVSQRYGIGEDAAVLYLMLLTLPDPTDRNAARWTGWAAQRGGTARLRAARAELAATDLVVEGSRSKAGRSLFLPGGWTRLTAPHLPLEQWKLPMYGLHDDEEPVLGVVVPHLPVADLYRRAWQRILDGDHPRPTEPEAPRPRKRRR